MGAETTIYVMVYKLEPAWVKISAVTLDEAKDRARDIRSVGYVAKAQYEDPNEEIWTDWTMV
jgi:hypothetical protein